MKSFLTAALLLAGFSAIANAETLTPESCGTGQTANCQNPAADVAFLTYNYVYGNASIFVGGELYTATVATPTPPYTSVSFSQLFYAADGTSRLVTATLNVKSVHSGRTTVLQWSLVSGDVE